MRVGSQTCGSQAHNLTAWTMHTSRTHRRVALANVDREPRAMAIRRIKGVYEMYTLFTG